MDRCERGPPQNYASLWPDTVEACRICIVRSDYSRSCPHPKLGEAEYNEAHSMHNERGSFLLSQLKPGSDRPMTHGLALPRTENMLWHDGEAFLTPPPLMCDGAAMHLDSYFANMIRQAVESSPTLLTRVSVTRAVSLWRHLPFEPHGRWQIGCRDGRRCRGAPRRYRDSSSDRRIEDARGHRPGRLLCDELGCSGPSS